jgi:hypothetical protein
LLKTVARIDTNLQTLVRVFENRREATVRIEARADRLRSEIADLRTAFSEVALPVFPPEITAIATQFENSVEASK